MALPNGWPTKTPVVCPRSFVLTYRATIPLSTGSLTHLADLLRAERIRRGTLKGAIIARLLLEPVGL